MLLREVQCRPACDTPRSDGRVMLRRIGRWWLDDMERAVGSSATWTFWLGAACQLGFAFVIGRMAVLLVARW